MKKTTIGEKIEVLLSADQNDRANRKWQRLPEEKRWEIINGRDKKRKLTLLKILKSHPKLTGDDYFRAGMIFQHGDSIEDIQKAKRLALKGHHLGSKDAGWLYAAATDRERIMCDKKQKFGTQFGLKNGKWVLFPVLRSTTDAMRAKFNLATLKEIKKTNPAASKKKNGFGLTSKR